MDAMERTILQLSWLLISSTPSYPLSMLTLDPAFLKVNSAQSTACQVSTEKEKLLGLEFLAAYFTCWVSVCWSTLSPRYAHFPLCPRVCLDLHLWSKWQCQKAQPFDLSVQLLISSAGLALFCGPCATHSFRESTKAGPEHFSLAPLAHLTLESRMSGM